MRKLIAGMKISLDGKITGPTGVADWVDGWSEDYGLSSQIDACLLGGGMYPGYEAYWTAVQNASGEPLPMTADRRLPENLNGRRSPRARPITLLSNTVAHAAWRHTRFLKSVSEVAALKRQAGEGVYLMGGARITASLIEAGLVDELRLIVYPLIAGGAGPVSAIEGRHGLKFRGARQINDEQICLAYALG
ncbi:MAG: dihydrofolate reductase family protein [Alphaproteobacteria bacterium]